MDNREIDKLVAEKVMECTLQITGGDYNRWILPNGNCLGNDQWSPSTDISAAWRVAEMLEHRFGCDVNTEIRRKSMDQVWTGERWESKRYYVHISGGNLGYDSFNCSFTVYDDSPCLAICLAALKAVESEVKEEAE